MAAGRRVLGAMGLALTLGALALLGAWRVGWANPGTAILIGLLATTHCVLVLDGVLRARRERRAAAGAEVDAEARQRAPIGPRRRDWQLTAQQLSQCVISYAFLWVLVRPLGEAMSPVLDAALVLLAVCCIYILVPRPFAKSRSGARAPGGSTLH